MGRCLPAMSFSETGVLIEESVVHRPFAGWAYPRALSLRS